MRSNSVIWIVIVVLAGVLFGVLLSVSACGQPSQTEWVLTEDPKGNALDVEIAIGNSCKSLDRIDVDEFPDLVKISAYVETHGSDCDDIQQIERREIQLDEPLGSRELAGCDPPGRNVFRGAGLVDCRSVKN